MHASVLDSNMTWMTSFVSVGVRLPAADAKEDEDWIWDRDSTAFYPHQASLINTLIRNCLGLFSASKVFGPQPCFAYRLVSLGSSIL